MFRKRSRMGFKAKKVYGQSKQLECPFCGKIATTRNEKGVDVCVQHQKEVLEEIKCTCGSWLEQRSGKFGPYFNCINCGNMNFSKGMEMKNITARPSQEKVTIEKKPIEKEPPKEITITSDDVFYFD